MTKVTFIENNGNRIEAIAEVGQSLMQVAVNSGVSGISAECGGACACGTCHCYVVGNGLVTLPTPDCDEADMIEFVIDPKANSRLSCQIAITPDLDGLVVHIPASQT
jgi:2Fe-2S ferredoxin